MGATATDSKVSGLAAIDRAKQHFTDLGAIRLEVREWADDKGRPMVITASPLNLREKDHLQALGKTYGAESLELCVHILILHARDANGKPLFTLEHKQDLMNRVCPNVISRIALAIVEGPTPADVKKNSRPTVI